MKLITREIFEEYGKHSGAPGAGGLTYLSATQNQLHMFRAWETQSDIVQKMYRSFSPDNGRSWSEPELFFEPQAVPGGTEFLNDAAAFLDPVTDKVIFIFDHYIESKRESELHDVRLDLLFAEYDHRTGEFQRREITNFGHPQGLYISMCRPLLLTPDKVLVPAKTLVVDEAGTVVRYPGSRLAMQQSLVVIGERQTGSWHWRLGGKVPPLPMEVSCRGCHEHSVAKLGDGRLVTVIRGDNGMFAERPGFKWQSFSLDDGETWTRPEPVRYTDGGLMESGSNAPMLFRSQKTGKLYFIGNPCVDGERADFNWPRSPLAIFEVQEKPFALRRDTMFKVDERQPHEPVGVQLTNFSFYEDRTDGSLVMFLTRLGAKDPNDWRIADLYRYRIELD